MEIYAVYGCLSMAVALLGRLRPLGGAFFLFAFWFVSLRFETGFDWPIYQGLFNEMRGNFTPFDLSRYGHLYNGEPAFLLLLGAFSWVMLTYQWAQFAFSAFFFLSLLALGRYFARDKVFVFVAIALSYIVLTVGFSTVRQSISIALFGFALVLYAKEKRGWAFVLMAVAVLFQHSSALYVIGFAAFLASQRYDRSRFGVPTFLAILVPLAIAAGALLLWAKSGNYPSDVRVAFYLEALSSYRLTLWDLAHVLIFLAMALHAMLTPMRSGAEADDELMITRLVVVFSAIALAATLVPIIRERVSYELWILYALFLTYNRAILRQVAVVCVVALGLLYNGYAMLKYPNGLMFVPYQNVSLPRNAIERPYSEFMREHLELTLPPTSIQRDRVNSP